MDMGANPSNIDIDPSLVFILTPFDKAHEADYSAIAEACLDAGFQPRRGDEEKIDGPILHHIINGILTADVVIANINGRNANVFYELGIAQALGKRVIIVARYRADDVPFDLRQQQLILYNDLTDLREKLLVALNRSYSSSVIRSFNYDSSTGDLRISFVGGRSYLYRGVPNDVFERLRSAHSKGSFFETEIRDRYPFEASK